MSQKSHLYQHRPGSFIRECIVMVMPNHNVKILDKSLQKQQKKTPTCNIIPKNSVKDINCISKITG